MPDTDKPVQPGAARFKPETEMAPLLGVSVSFLQKDRRGSKLIPFIQLGGKVLYDPEEVFPAVKALTRGGDRSRRGRIKTGAGQ